MNKLFTFLASAALISLSACSSDDPAVKGPDKPDDGKLSDMYLSVKISYADASRAEGDTPTEDNNFQIGNSDEHKIASAYFFFFNSDESYYTEAEITDISGFNSGATINKDNQNVELESTSMLVLRNISKNEIKGNLYLVTILNAGTEFISKIRGMAKNHTLKLSSLADERLTSLTDDGGNFTMTTTSFFDGDKENYNNTYNYANIVKPDALLEEIPDDKTQIDANAVTVYVERLAAKITVTGLNQEYYEIVQSISGNVNTDKTEGSGTSTQAEEGTSTTTPSAHSTVYVKILGVGASNHESEIFLSKKISPFMTDNSTNNKATLTDLGWDWNDPTNFRSYWAQSVSYGQKKEFESVTAPEIEGKPISNGTVSFDLPFYTFETTNTVEKIVKDDKNRLNQKSTPSIRVLAQAYEKVGDTYKALSLVKYNGIYYRMESFFDYALSRLPHAYYKVKETVEGEGENQKTTTTITKIGRESATLELRTDALTGTASVHVKSTIPGEITLYKLKDGIGKTEPQTKEDLVEVENGTKLFAEQLDGITKNAKATAYTDGYMFYPVSIEHLLKKQGTNAKNLIVEGEGNYGVVRNHWYQITIDQILKLGHGIFNPYKKENVDNPDPEPLDPDDPTESYAMGARVRVLQWKIVRQNVVL